MSGKTYFKEFIDKFVELEDYRPTLLPLLHGAKAVRVRDILNEGELKTGKECSVLKKELVFTFYGRPAYKVKPDNEVIGQPVAAPCFFLLKKELLKNVQAIHALDTGAFATEFYKQFVDIDLHAEDFSIGGTRAEVNALIRLFFGNSENYFQVLPTEGVDIPAGQHEASAYYQMMTNTSNEVRYDDRSSAIECVFNKNISINAENVEAILIPSVFADDEHYGTIAKSLGIELILYSLTPSFTSGNHVTRIYDAVEQYYHEKGYF